MKRAIIIGATSGIGRELARILGSHGYELGITGRRVQLLESLASEVGTTTYIQEMDVANTKGARKQLHELFERMSDVDLVIINAGIGTGHNPVWEREAEVIQINVAGFVAMATASWDYFSARGSGHIVGISSIASLKGFGRSAAYCGSKAFISTYMQAMRQRSNATKKNIIVTDIKPGYVVSEMTDGRQGMFWLASTEKACQQIWTAIKRKRSNAYITRRWRIAAWFIKAVPDWIFVRI